MKIDLHCHSYFSDGKHSPDFLLQCARENQVSHLAITDHDCLSACLQFSQGVDDLELINGVEISCAWENQEIHILGLLLQLDAIEMTELLARQQYMRKQRMLKMDQRLQALGTGGLWEYLESLRCHAYTRSHAADFLVQQGICKNRQKAFKTYLGKQGKIYAAPEWCSLQQAVATILDANGIAVLAHPSRYPLSKRKLENLVTDFRNAGGEGIEVSYSNIDPATRRYLGDLATTNNLYSSVGSDFHDIDATWAAIGKFPPLDAETKKNAIWLHPKWHF